MLVKNRSSRMRSGLKLTIEVNLLALEVISSLAGPNPFNRQIHSIGKSSHSERDQINMSPIP